MCLQLSWGGRVPGLNPHCRAAVPHQAEQGEGLPNPTTAAQHCSLPEAWAVNITGYLQGPACPITQAECPAAAALAAGKAAAQSQLLGSALGSLTKAISLDPSNEQEVMAEVLCPWLFVAREENKPAA